MMSRVYSACPYGVSAIPITVEVDVRGNSLKVSIVGLPDPAIKESKDRGGSAQVHGKLLRVARTIADLAAREEIIEQDLLEALGYRQLDFGNLNKSLQASQEVLR